jgi:ribonuclease T
MSIIKINKRFRGFLPVIVDVETGGLDPEKNSLLELCAIFIGLNDKGIYYPSETIHYNIEAHKETETTAVALEINGIKPGHPFRSEVTEQHALTETFKQIRLKLKQTNCSRAVLVGHNAPFDLSFIQGACQRNNIKRNPFHKFTTLDTASICAIVYGETVLAKAMEKAKIDFDATQAHSALYDTQKTAELFCQILNITPFFPLA